MSYTRQQQSQGLDLASPLVEILQGMLTMLGIVLFKLAKFLFTLIYRKIAAKYFGIYFSNPVTLKHLKKKTQTTDQNALGYSCNNRRVFKLSELDTKKHTAVIGSTGSGKSVCLHQLIDHALSKGMPVIYFDPKANFDSIETFKKMCASQGKKLYLFSDIVENASFFNPLLDGTLNDISDRIINALEWSEPFYKNESIMALDDVLEALKENGFPITMAKILQGLICHSKSKNISGLINQLSKVSKSDFGKLINNESSEVLTFNRLRAENACLYIGISAMGFSSSGSILNKIFFGALLTHAKDSLIGKVPKVLDPLAKPISVVFDELSSTIHEGFIDLQNKCRQAGIEITYATQGPSDIDRISPALTAQIFENTNNLFVFNQIVPAHTEFFARTFGTVTSIKKTHVIEEERKQSKGTMREVEEFMVHSNIFRGLRVGQCVLLQRTPKRVDLINIRNRTKEGKRPAKIKQLQRANSVI